MEYYEFLKYYLETKTITIPLYIFRENFFDRDIILQHVAYNPNQFTKLVKTKNVHEINDL